MSNERKIITGIDPETGHVGPRYEMDPDSPAYQPIQPRSLTPELLAAKFVGSLGAKLAEYEDAETAIAVYRQANVTINELKRIKELCLDLAQSELRANGETHRATVLGSAGWSQPKRRAWTKAHGSMPLPWNRTWPKSRLILTGLKSCSKWPRNRLWCCPSRPFLSGNQ